jgi:hypothetical protein
VSGGFLCLRPTFRDEAQDGCYGGCAQAKVATAATETANYPSLQWMPSEAYQSTQTTSPSYAESVI